MDGATPERELTPAESLALIDSQRRKVHQETDIDPRLLYGAWGTAWLVGFLLLAVSAGADPIARIPPLVVGLAFFVLLASAMVVTIVHTARAVRGIEGDNSMAGAFYGWSWFLGFAGLAAIIVATADFVGDETVHQLLWPAGSGLITGVLYTCGSAIWREPYQFALGAWLILTTAVGALLGIPGIYWVMGLAGGGGFLLSAAWFAVQRRGGWP